MTIMTVCLFLILVDSFYHFPEKVDSRFPEMVDIFPEIVDIATENHHPKLG